MNGVFSLVFGAAFFTCSGFAGTVHYVDVDNIPGGDGSSWSLAFEDLQTAIDASVPGDEIWVRMGMYQPTTPAAGSSDSGYLLKDGVALYGGFNGTETQRQQRNAASNITTLSAADANVLHVMEGVGIGPSAIIDGFTISDGTADDTGIGGVGGAGGGMLLVGASPTVVDCIFTNNSTRLGSGVYVQDGNPVFVECTFESNVSTRSGEGGGIYATATVPGQTYTLDVIDCQFRFNSVTQGHWATGNGGGIFADDGVVLSVSDSVFESNYGWHNNTFGNAVVGGAIAALGDGTLIQNSEFISNYSNLGAGVYSGGDIQIIQSLFVANRAVGAMTCAGFDCPTDVPDVFSGWGGAIFVNTFAVADVVQSTIASNWSAKSGGGVVASGTIRNSVLWDNRSPQPVAGEDPLPLSRMQYEDAQIEYSCVEGLLTPPLGEDPPNPSDFPGSHEQDPQFVSGTVISEDFGWLLGPLGDHRLVSGSPAIDAGDNAMVPVGIGVDFDGLSRFVDDPDTADTGLGTSPIVDMGAYEFQSSSICLADINNDGILDIADVFAFLDAYNAAAPQADLNADGLVDITDVFAFLDAYNTGCP